MPRPYRSSSSLGGALLLSAWALGCSGPVDLGSDLLWSAEHESGDFSEWTRDGGGNTRLPVPETTIVASSERARTGRFSLELSNPAIWPGPRSEGDPPEGQQGPELFHSVGAFDDAYYSAWFFLPDDYVLEPSLALLRLRSQDTPDGELSSGPELHLRSTADGGYVLLVFSHDPSFLHSPVAEPAPLIAARRWFQLETRYEPRSLGRLRVWLDGRLVYDLQGRPRAANSLIVFSVCNIVEVATPSPIVLFVDDAAASLSRVSPSGRFSTARED